MLVPAASSPAFAVRRAFNRSFSSSFLLCSELSSHSAIPEEETGHISGSPSVLFAMLLPCGSWPGMLRLSACPACGNKNT